MACNCKRAKKFAEENEIPQYDNIVAKVNKWLFIVFFFILAVFLAVIIVPYIVFYSVYAIFFGDNKITLPKFLRKYME